MKIACFIPIKENSERVKGKNFRKLGEKKLYEYIIENAIEANIFDDIYIDTNSKEIKEYALERKLSVIDREAYLSTNTANGNDLLCFHAKIRPEYDYYFQLFATSPFLKPSTIKECVEKLIQSEIYDSCFTGKECHGFYWLNHLPINYQPYILPRSQDLVPVIEETTGLYGIKKESLIKYNCRIGRSPYIKIVDLFEAIDINNEDDFRLAECILKVINKDD